MGRSTNGDRDDEPLGDRDELPAHDGIVSDFALDRFEVTVGRFRNFVAAYSGPPAVDAGAHFRLPGSGWRSEWNSQMPADRAALIANVKCAPPTHTWTDQPGQKETFPINCVSWYEAFAFCAWDGGRLATELEWEYAAAGGNENRLYPWGEGDPDADMRVIFGVVSGVGSAPNGVGRFGQDDLAASMWEWVLDWYAADFYAQGACRDCANIAGESSERVARGGAYIGRQLDLRAAARDPVAPSQRDADIGIRCARRN